jgi:hypothetical protein
MDEFELIPVFFPDQCGHVVKRSARECMMVFLPGLITSSSF